MGWNFSLSGIGLGIYLIASGIAYFLDMSSGTGYLTTVLKLYPILPILLGIDYILPGLKAHEDKGRRPEGWVVTVIILITIGGIAYSAFNEALKTNWRDLDQIFRSHRVMNLDNYKEKTDEQNFQLPDNISTVRIENNFGDIKVNLNANAGKTVTSTAVIKYPVLSQKETDAYREELKISGKTQGDIFLIKLQQPETKDRRDLQATANITVTVPPEISVELQNTFGKINVGEIRGNLKIDNSNGRIEVEKVSGDATINDQFSTVDMGEIDGNLKIDVITGSINIRKVGQSLTAHNSFGSIKIGAVGGASNITSSNSRIQIDENNGPTEIENSFGDVSLENCSGSLNAKVSNGRLKVNTVKIDGPYDIEVKFGGVSLDIPRDAKFSLDAKTSFGDINTDFNVAVQKETTKATANGDINGGGPLVKIESSNGNIDLKQN